MLRYLLLRCSLELSRRDDSYEGLKNIFLFRNKIPILPGAVVLLCGGEMYHRVEDFIIPLFQVNS